MKFNRILSMLLAVIMLSTALIAVIPAVTVSAANSEESTEFNIQPTIYPLYIDGTWDTQAFNAFKNALSQNTDGSAIASTAELLEKELAAGQLMYTNSPDGMYTIYVNVYTGFMYYKNNLTGQVLSSNYYKGSASGTATDDIFSQIHIEYYNITNTSETRNLYSFTGSAARGQIYVSKLTNGIRVNYTLGDTKLRYLVPGRISEERYMDNIVSPILEVYLAAVAEKLKDATSMKVDGKQIQSYTELINMYFGTTDPANSSNAAINFFRDYLKYYRPGNEGPSKGKSYLFDLAALIMNKDTSGQKQFSEFVTTGAIDDFNGVITTLAQMFDLDTEVKYCPTHKAAGKRNDPDHCKHCEQELKVGTVREYIFYDADGGLNTMTLSKYLDFIAATLQDLFETSNPLQKELYASFYGYLIKSYKNGEDGAYVYCNLVPGTDDVNFAKVEALIKKYCLLVDEPTYSYNDMYKDEKEWGYEHQYVNKPVFRCALEYTFNSDGSLCITLPANSISFDESSYILGKITPLKYFGSGDINAKDYNGESSGYVFYPDGSGAIINYADFNTSKVGVINKAQIYGIDYAYSDIYKIIGDYREQITMPVYGMVYTESADEKTAAITGTDTLNNGYFAVIEEGAALATLHAEIDSTGSKLGKAYATYQPYSSDTYDLSKTISVGGLGEYKMTAKSKYNGSYKTRVNMLSDAKLNAAYGTNNYNASYVGMAECYRELLKANGTITALADIGNDLPLYVEAFGSMEVTKKILSFPVEVALELTTFNDIRTMYDQFADAKAVLHEKAVEYQRQADEEEKDLALKALYEEKAREYLALEEKVENITNINFRLTGFANGGMKYTYPSKLKWDKVVGGKDGFERLVNYAGDVATRDGANLGLFPEFDFLYINNTAAFDGISSNKISSKLIDNRYANKQLYNSVTHVYETLVTRVVSADVLAEFYVKFNKDFSKFDIKSISVSTLGSDVSSNFDDENPINRDEAAGYISDLLSAMHNDGYEIMVNKGNSYAVEYASHIIDAYIDSSHLTDSSYTVPFFGMVLHGYVSYTGGALNYSGDPDYDILRSIESGASLYYILCYQNTEKMKEDLELNKYYGVSYINWFDKIVEQYNTINSAIGSLQTYEIVDHKLLKVERVIDEGERERAYSSLVNELVDNIRNQIQARINAAFDEMKANGEYGRGVQVEIDRNAVIAEAAAMLNLENNMQIPSDYAKQIKATIMVYLDAIEDEFNQDKYPVISDNPYKVVYGDVEDYTSKYNYVTDSYSTDGSDYVKTDYTVDNYNVVLVTYRDAATGDEVSFVLNYNIYEVIVNIEGEEAFVLPKYGFEILK